MNAAGTSTALLIVEDELIIARDLQQVLRGMGYDPYAIVPSADEALRVASERCPDLVLMDIKLKGGRDGIEAAALLRDRFGVPVVYLTAHADEGTLERAKKTLPFAYLTKPVRADELHRVIEVSLYRHEMEKRLRQRERWFSTTLHSIADAVIAVDKRIVAELLAFARPPSTPWERPTSVPRSCGPCVPPRTPSTIEPR